MGIGSKTIPFAKDARMLSEMYYVGTIPTSRWWKHLCRKSALPDAIRQSKTILGAILGAGLAF